MSTTYYSAFFFFNDTATTEIYTLSLHDALPIYRRSGDHLRDGGLRSGGSQDWVRGRSALHGRHVLGPDRKSTRLNSSHANISYAVFCLKKKTTSVYNKYFSTKFR